MPQKKSDIPILYLYIYRTIKNGCDRTLLIDTSLAINSLSKVIRRAPRIVYREILNELVAMGLLKKLNIRKYILTPNKNIESKLSKLKDYVFPFEPTYDDNSSQLSS